jgi:hypothetical protein
MTFEACAPLSLFAIFPRVCARGGSIIWNTLKCRREKQTPIQVVAPLLLLAGAHAIFISFFPGRAAAYLASSETAIIMRVE